MRKVGLRVRERGIDTHVLKGREAQLALPDPSSACLKGAAHPRRPRQREAPPPPQRGERAPPLPRRRQME